MTTKTFLAKLKAINDASDQSYEFIKHCYGQGLCTITEDRKAVKKVHEETMIDLMKVSKESALDIEAKDNEYQMYNFN